MNPYLARRLLLLVVVVFWAGCGAKKTDPELFKERLQKLAARETDKLDCRDLPKIGDAEMKLLAECPEVDSLHQLILDNTQVTDAGIRDLPPLPHLAMFSASKTRLTDEAIAKLCRGANLETLRLDQGRITDVGLQSIGEIKSLRSLSLWRCPVTDEGLAHLKSLTKLNSLSLDETGVTNKGLQYIPALTALRSLSLWKTKVTPEAVEELKKQTPELKVNR